MRKSLLVAVLCLMSGSQQHLNGESEISVPLPNGTIIETYGSTSLAKVGNTFLLQPVAGSAVVLSYNGSPVIDGEFSDSGSPWKPIAAEKTATGFEVAWKVANADKYRVWCTDADGNYLFSALSDARASSVELQAFDISFQQDLSGEGVTARMASDLGDRPRFVFKGTDGAGAQLYDVKWKTRGSHPFTVRVLTPAHPSSAYPHSFLIDLPVQPGLAQATWGSGLDELAKLDVEDRYNTTIIEPIFPIDPWYADSPKDPTINYETFIASILPRWIGSIFPDTDGDNYMLIGLSKSGYGAMDLLLKHPDTFLAAAAFDFPAEMASYNDFGRSSSGDYGTEENFHDNYELTDAFVDNLKAPFTTNERILISSGSVFPLQVTHLDTLFTSLGVAHKLLIQTSNAHNWYSGWLPDAVAGLFALEKNSISPRPDRGASCSLAMPPKGPPDHAPQSASSVPMSRSRHAIR
jgi:hypothetical protein